MGLLKRNVHIHIFLSIYPDSFFQMVQKSLVPGIRVINILESYLSLLCSFIVGHGILESIICFLQTACQSFSFRVCVHTIIPQSFASDHFERQWSDQWVPQIDDTFSTHSRRLAHRAPWHWLLQPTCQLEIHEH